VGSTDLRWGRDSAPSCSFRTAQLNRALQLYLTTWDDTRNETLRLALERLCTEAHAAKLDPERMLVAVKDAWARVPGIATMPYVRGESLRARSPSLVLASYLASSVAVRTLSCHTRVVTADAPQHRCRVLLARRAPRVRTAPVASYPFGGTACSCSSRT
jgi:hypothetical protein